ncbi:phycobiliprotein lyase [Leptolyngbya sp. FACHB-261]|uniref:phycobiliprotein lyase n=1 Tax=Leptolyngbya sp. FACHB-261 TaxID=2692806 RepID=UPI0028C48DFE|nr:phycobiliprotein lyase [Leptolyngbya sp. FACHB-261]
MQFFQQSAGRWRSQRTSHHLVFQKSESGKSEIQIDILQPGSPEVIALCEQHGFDPAQALGGAKVTWSGTMEWDQEKHEGSTVLVPIAEEDKPNEGKLLRQQGYAEKAPVAGRYSMGDDGVLSLITEYETMYSEEKLWFPRPNLRLRTGLIIGPSNMASFCSEIRLSPAKAESTEGTAVAAQ